MSLLLFVSFGIPGLAPAQILTNSNGNVGIKADPHPLLALQIGGNPAGISIVGSQPVLSLEAPSGSKWVWAGSRDDVGGTNDDLKLLRYDQGSYKGIALRVETATGNANFGGSVGVGTVTPDAKIHVAGGPGGNIRLQPAGPDAAWSTFAMSSPADGGEQRFTWISAGADSAGLPEGNSLYLFQYPPSGGYRLHAQFKEVNGVSQVSFWGNVDVRGKVAASTLELTSDREQKTNFRGLRTHEILDKVLQLPLSSWEYTNSPSVRHIGPMAQDFKAAFDFGEDDRHISVVDGLGVAFAALQGVNAKLEDSLRGKEAKLIELEKQVLSLKRELTQVQSLVADRLATLEAAVKRANAQD